MNKPLRINRQASQCSFWARLAKSQQGVTLITVVALLLMMVVAFAALFGSSYMAAGKAQIINIANVSALAAVKGYVEANPKPTPGSPEEYFIRAASAKSRAIEIAGQNKIKGVTGALGLGMADSTAWPPQQSDGAVLTLGRWYPTPTPATAAATTCTQFPCFEPNGTVPVSGVKQQANAAGVQICTDNQTSPLMIPFVGKQVQCASSIATLAQRCVVFLLDASMSTTLETHQPITSNMTVEEVDADGNGSVDSGVYRITSPRENDDNTVPYNSLTNRYTASLAFYRASSIEDVGVLIDDDGCNNPATFSGITRDVLRERLHWCTMGGDRAGGVMTNTHIHFRSDYQKRTVPGGESIYTDALKSSAIDYWAPQPLGTTLLAINAATRSLLQWQTGGDRVALIAFRGNIVSRVPNQGMTTDLEYLVQLTNFDNRGTIDESGGTVTTEKHPNALDMSWYPLLTKSKYDANTNIILGFETAIETIKTYCPKNAEKTIVLFSDGLPSCSRNAADADGYECPDETYTLDQRASLFGAASSQFNGRYVGGTAQDPTRDWYGNNPSIQKLLKINRIHATIIQSGDHAGPNTRNILIGGQYLTHDEAQGLNKSPSGLTAGDYANWYATWYSRYAGMDKLWWSPPVDVRDPSERNLDPASYACRHIGEPGMVCGGMNPQLAQLAMETGGYYCPLRPPCTAVGAPANAGIVCVGGNSGCRTENPNHPSACAKDAQGNPLPGGCYESFGTPPRLKDSARNAGSALTCAEYKQTKSEQAAACAVQSMGTNPYILVAKEP